MSKVEYLDIVDGEDNVIGRGTRKAVHDNYEIHRGVHVFVINDKSELLIQQRKLTKDYYPGYFDSSVGAQVLSGETYEDAARREAYEELKIKNVKLEKICKYKSFSERQREFRTLFITIHNGQFTISETEVEKVEFLPIRSIQKMIDNNERDFTEGFKISFGYYQKFLSKQSN